MIRQSQGTRTLLTAAAGKRVSFTLNYALMMSEKMVCNPRHPAHEEALLTLQFPRGIVLYPIDTCSGDPQGTVFAPWSSHIQGRRQHHHPQPSLAGEADAGPPLYLITSRQDRRRTQTLSRLLLGLIILSQEALHVGCVYLAI